MRTHKAIDPETAVFQIKITLQGSAPAIWRRLLVPANIDLPKLHWVIQIAMGWEDDHMHEFYSLQGRKRLPYGSTEMDQFLGTGDDSEEADYTLRGVAPRGRSKLYYTYDFGDCWEHEILVEKTLPPVQGQALPTCLEGEMACPPEDSGGVWGYEEKLRALSDPKDRYHGEVAEWMGEDFDPTAFDLESVNRMLAKAFKKKKA